MSNPITADKFASHVVAMPYPGRGHINPLLNLCRSLSSRNKHTLFTVVVTKEWLGLLGSEIMPENMKFASIPNVVPSEAGRAADIIGFVESVQTKLEDPFERLLNQLEPPVKLIVSDTILQWVVLLGNRRNIPVASFWTSSASIFSIAYHHGLILQNNHSSLEERGDELADYIPGLPALKLVDLLPFSTVKNQIFEKIVAAFSLVPKAQYLLIVSIYEFESKVINALRSSLSIPIFTVGPNIPHFSLQVNSLGITKSTDSSCYMKWLDSQSPGTVLYISYGSLLSVSSPQMDEIAVGLVESGVPFFWVARGEASRLKEVCSGAGIVVDWCEQLRVLCHSSVGGFWSHCGWSSVMESVYAGVPLIASPITADQPMNAKLVTEDWKIGCKMKIEVGNERWMKREEIVEVVTRFMDNENLERKEMVKRVKALQQKARNAVENGGSSDMNLNTISQVF
uniref:UDP-glucosyltransferase 87K2 n=1 Tax=Centella asiatica TaxID=48106 RepID=A0A2I7M6D5_CENAS|nr:UDP-glucosyltransferase 87K2 [Centella asiatica]